MKTYRLISLNEFIRCFNSIKYVSQLMSVEDALRITCGIVCMELIDSLKETEERLIFLLENSDKMKKLGLHHQEEIEKFLDDNFKKIANT